MLAVLDRERNAGSEAAARAAHQDRIRRGADGLRLRHQLETGRALAGDDVEVVIGMDSAALRSSQNRRAISSRSSVLPIIEMNFGAEPLVRAIFSFGASAGMTIIDGMPHSVAAAATPCA